MLVIGLVVGLVVGAIAYFIQWLPTSAGEEADRIDFVFWFTTIISIVVFAIVAAALLYSVWKFRAGPDDDSDGLPIHGHTGIEIAWTAFPAVLVTAIAIVSAIVLARNGEAGPNPLKIEVTAQQFAWSFTYPNGTQSGVLRLPVGRHTELRITAKDVLHSFWVPQLGQKQDAVPGQFNKLVITPNRTGTFPVICTELCGLGHSVMRTVAIVMEPAAYEQWTKGGAQAAGGGSPGAVAAKTFAANGCGGCHTFTPAKAAGKIGPDLDKLAAEAQRAGKPLDAFVRQSIVDPAAYLEPGFQDQMPHTFGKTIPPKELDALVQYLAKGSS